MKYIMFDSPSHGLFPLIFSDNVGHDEIAHAISLTYPYIKPVSAGFVSVSPSEDCPRHLLDVSCFGESNSLGLKAASTDYILVEKMLNQ